MPCVYEFWPSADMSVPETQLNQGFANRALPVMYLSTANSGLIISHSLACSRSPSTARPRGGPVSVPSTLQVAKTTIGALPHPDTPKSRQVTPKDFIIDPVQSLGMPFPPINLGALSIDLAHGTRCCTVSG
jgi:hypothetical protein